MTAHDEYQTGENDKRPDKCPKCKSSFDDRSVGKMTQEQVDLLEVGVCPTCGATI